MWFHRTRDRSPRGARRLAAALAATLGAAALTAALAAVSGTPPAAARPGAQPAPPATAVPRPTAAQGAGISGALPRCDGSLTAAPTSANLRVGDLVTVTARARFDCPRLLEHRGVVLVVGTVPANALEGARAGLSHVVDAVAAAGTSRLAVLEVAAPEAPVVWSATPKALAATAARLRALTARESRAATAWLAALDAADAALRALPPTLRPMLVVADGALPTSNRDAVVQRLADVVHGCHDATGHSVLISLASESWFELPVASDPTFGARAIIVRPTGEGSDSGLTLGTIHVMAAFQAPVGRFQIAFNYSHTPELLEVVRPDPPPTDVGPGVVAWDPPVAGHTAAAVVTASLRAASPRTARHMVITAVASRFGTRNDVFLSVPFVYCIDPAAPQPVPCDAAATPTPAPSTPGRPSPPTRPPEHDPIAPATPGPPIDRARLFVPLALRGLE